MYDNTFVCNCPTGFTGSLCQGKCFAFQWIDSIELSNTSGVAGIAQLPKKLLFGGVS